MSNFLQKRFRSAMLIGGLCAMLLAIGTLVQHRGSLSAEANTPDNSMTISVRPTVELADARRLGINLGSHDRFGASQLLKNVIINPGFEAAEYAQIFHTSADATGSRIQQENWRISYNPFTSFDEGFWTDASYEITYGPAKGRSGNIDNFTHEDDKYTYYLDSGGAAPDLFDVVIVRTEKDGISYPGPATPYSALETSDAHTGDQSIRLLPPDQVWRASHEYYMDTLRQVDTSAGMMFEFEGEWCLDYWAKAANPTDELNVFMWRVNGNGAFMFNTPYTPISANWRKYSFSFTIDPNDNRNLNGERGDSNFIPPIEPGTERALMVDPAVTLGFRSSPTNDDIWIDDVALYPCDDTNPTAFSDTYVDLLKELNPGTLRDWGLQLGSSLDNQLASPFERKSTWHNPRLNDTPTLWHYSLHEFLELAQEVGANPWYNIPPTVSDQEMANLAEYLSAPATGAYPYALKRAQLGQQAPWTDVFDIIHLEYGNEMWGSNDGGDPFLGATAKGGARLGQLADMRFEALNSGLQSGVTNINRIIGGQVGFPYTQREIEQNSDAHDTIALAPYFSYNIEYANTDEDLYYPSYLRAIQDLADGEFFDEIQGHIDAEGNGTGLAIYEINFHTTGSTTAPLAKRNDFVTGLNGGLALPFYMLTYQKELGLRDQTAFQAAQYSFKTPDDDYVRLWGLLRDLEATGRKRPTWLGLEIVNKAIQGDMVRTVQTGAPLRNQPAIGEIDSSFVISLVQSFAFVDDNDLSLVVFNFDLDEAHTVELDLRVPAGATATRHLLTSASIHDDNESAENITITTNAISNFGSDYSFTAPPSSITVFEWEGIDTSGLDKDTYLPFVTK